MADRPRGRGSIRYTPAVEAAEPSPSGRQRSRYDRSRSRSIDRYRQARSTMRRYSESPERGGDSPRERSRSRSRDRERLPEGRPPRDRSRWCDGEADRREYNSRDSRRSIEHRDGLPAGNGSDQWRPSGQHREREMECRDRPSYSRGGRMRREVEEQRWAHGRYEGGGVEAGGQEQQQRGWYRGSTAAAVGTSDRDPYSMARRSLAYEREPERAAAADPPSAGGSGSGRPYLEREDRQSSHDEYEWKSKAGGVAIFVKKPTSIASSTAAGASLPRDTRG